MRCRADTERANNECNSSDLSTNTGCVTPAARRRNSHSRSSGTSPHTGLLERARQKKTSDSHASTPVFWESVRDSHAARDFCTQLLNLPTLLLDTLCEVIHHLAKTRRWRKSLNRYSFQLLTPRSFQTLPVSTQLTRRAVNVF